MGIVPRACPKCGGREITNRPANGEAQWQASCDKCGVKTPPAPTADAAWVNWNSTVPTP